MAIKFTNNASSKLAAAINDSVTSFTIQTADVAKFPTLASGDYCILTLVGDNGNHEIVKATAISSSGVCTVVRAQEGTTAKSWPENTRVELRITAGYLNDTVTSSSIDETLPDNNTISVVNGKLQAKDVAIGGNKSDLASARGQIGQARYKTGVDLNDIIEAGFYIISAKTPNQNVPINTNIYLQVFRNKSFGAVQIAYTLNESASVSCYARRLTAGGAISRCLFHR